MEWVSHTTTGYFLGQLLVEEEGRPKRAGWWWAIASVSPDWLEWGTRWLGDIHRGVTHSLYFWPFLALAWAAAAHRWGRHESRQIASLPRLWGAFIIVVGSHMLLDVFMSYRWYLAWPFSQETWAWGIMPLFDVYVFAGWLCLWYLNRKLKLSTRTTARMGLAVLLVMFLARGVGKIRANALVTERLLLGSAAEIQTRPTYYQPWIWFVRNGSPNGEWKPVNILTGKMMQDYTRGRGFPPLPGREIIKLPSK